MNAQQLLASPTPVPVVEGALPRKGERAYVEYEHYEFGGADAFASGWGDDQKTAWRRLREKLEPFSEAVLDTLLADEGLASRVHGSVADIAAGSCWLSGKVSRLPAVDRVFAQDLSRGFLEKVGTQVYEDLGGDLSKLTLVTSDFNSIPLESGSLDAAFLFAALHHSLSPIPTLREVLRCLKPGGTLFIHESPVAQLGLERDRRWSETVHNACEIPTTFNDIRYYLNMSGAVNVTWRRLDFSRNKLRRAVRTVLRATHVENLLRPPAYLFMCEASS
ncbi:MAG: class I SAM-dependent methyltransferase [Chloroflexi bacterium]|nr:class I SAM-dependent methyltransferase [Chloroflexota bacterium]